MKTGKKKYISLQKSIWLMTLCAINIAKHAEKRFIFLLRIMLNK